MAILTKTKQTNAEKVQQVKQQVDTSLGMFSKIYSDLEEANTVLMNVIQEDTALIVSTQANVNTAKAELDSNLTLQEKIKQFTKEQN